MHPISAAGVVDTTVGIVGDAAGIDIKGTLKNNGTLVTSGTGNNSIGGSGEDGAITLSADTSYGAVVNATTFTLNATYTIYPATNKCLVTKSTAAYTLSGAVSCDGRSYIEPA
jgi:hypothetical protein